ncbi:hypothetical protein [Pseudomonas sp. PAMC 25886]|uniref:hypothetical protein n=1 Tax=Pseudomonas sp. PAMC 25886 TaxID=1125977 RepID=UPI00031B9EA8|nr:hypothetical protein [Pseudomonas sp. PAMC 25886]
MSKTEKTIWIDSIQLKQINGETYIPTVITYKSDDKVHIGTEAEEEEAKGHIANKNFKVDLGDITAGSALLERKKFQTNIDVEKSAFELTKNFFDTVLAYTTAFKAKDDYHRINAKIIVAEPLSFQIETPGKNWIKNYRDNIKRILHNFESIDFLPEPFAVYQYYRYGLRTPQLSDNIKHIALIIDFGGGTFDACIIESTNNGDISQSGKHAKPLAAASIPIGGFYINTILAEYLIKRDFDDPTTKSKIAQHITTAQRYRKGELKFDQLNDEKKSFIRNIEQIEKEIETTKKNLTNQITNWSIGNTVCYEKSPIKLPKNPFSSETLWYESELIGHQFKTVFEREVWDKQIKKTIAQVISRGREALRGRPITSTLISGGSSNIRILEKLLERDFSEELGHARPLPLSSSFQEVVAKGLAIECARRYFDHDSEFISVTYNPIKLILNPDEKGLESKRFTSIQDKIDMTNTKEGDLIPSAQSLKNFIDEPLSWKVKLSSPPKRILEYYFLRPQAESSEISIEERYNIESSKIHTRGDAFFESKTKVELTIKGDGTTTPRFIYSSGNPEKQIPEVSFEGKPFVIDMTSDSSNVQNNQFFIGFDFGTSNSSICELTDQNIVTITKRSNDASWSDLRKILPNLPYPIAIPLRKYLQVNHEKNAIDLARDAFEAALSFAAYTAASEANAHNVLGRAFNAFAHRSMGPLKALLECSLINLKSKSHFSKEYEKLFSELKPEFELAINQFTDHKHAKLESSKVEAHRHLTLIMNICNLALQDKIFGFFERISSSGIKRNQFSGLFRSAIDNQPFVDTLIYNGTIPFSQSECHIYDTETGNCLTLSPLIVFSEQANTTHQYQCNIFDKQEGYNYLFKPVDTENVFDSESICIGLKEQIVEQLYSVESSIENIVNIQLSSTPD